jgi:hypothetical protein
MSHSSRRLAYFAAVALAGTVLAGAAAAQQHPNLSGFWEPRAGAMKRPVPAALTPEAVELSKPPRPDTPAGILAVNGIDETDVNCLPAAQPWNIVQSPPIDIVQDDREMTVFVESRAMAWHIYSDGRGHPDMASYKRTLNGHSVGHWEGQEFVVDSVGFALRPGHGPFGDLPHNPTLHVTQRFHLENNGQELHAHFAVEDPKLFLHPYEYDFTWHRDPPGTFAAAEEICDARDPANGRY